MNILIVEDEIPAAEKMIKQIQALNLFVCSFIQLDSVEDSIAWFKSNPPPDLIFMDIHLADGICFKIFEKTEVLSPVIFTTAYDQYAIHAFHVNSIGYLLKPVTKKSLKKCLDKYKALKDVWISYQPDYSKLMRMIKNNEKEYKSRFLVKNGMKLIAINIGEIACFYADSKYTFLITKDNRKFITDYALDDLEDMIDPGIFFRINRKYLVCFNAIKEIHAHFKGRLKVFIDHLPDEDVIISNERAADFKEWLGR
ncbi:MAG: LytTR family DNA-binding domain-containing protein [Daejeonella sp.]